MSKGSNTPGKTPYQAARAIAAKDRQERRDQRPVEEQLGLLSERPGKSERERKRLEKLLD